MRECIELKEKIGVIFCKMLCFHDSLPLCTPDIRLRVNSPRWMHSAELLDGTARARALSYRAAPDHRDGIIPSPRALTISAVRNPVFANQRFRVTQ